MNIADVNYLSHSGFVVNFEGDVVIVDYYKRQFTNKWSIPLPKNPATYRSITVLVSHGHQDHFNPKIFSWRKERSNIAYVISADAKEKVDEALKDLGKKGIDIDGKPNITFLERGEETTVNRHVIRAFGSTDEGISFHIFSNNMSVFHAGDFNYWHWSDESSEDEVRIAREAFDKELDFIRNEICEIDIAFFPVDPRMGTDFFRGAVLFCKEMTPSWLIPMHFPDDFDMPPKLYDELATCTSFEEMHHSNEPVSFERDPSLDLIRDELENDGAAVFERIIDTDKT